MRRREQNGHTSYAAVDVVAALANIVDPAHYWADLKVREPSLAALVEDVEVESQEGQRSVVEMVELDGVLRLVQSISSPKSEVIKRWLAQTARERLDEAQDPELALLRARKLYEHKGYSPRWVDKRLRGVSARQELTGEWYKRGATDGEQFRTLTNEMVRAAFGMDVEGYRRYKNLTNTGENLRDHMTDLELSLTALAETVAVSLHRERSSQGVEQLVTDARDAGEVASRTRQDVESRMGRPVPAPGNHRAWWKSRGMRPSTSDAGAAARARPDKGRPTEASVDGDATRPTGKAVA